MDRSFHWYPILEILTNPDRVTHKKPSNILGKKSTAKTFVPFLESWPARIPCKRKAIKWSTRLYIKKKGRERKIEID